MRVTIKGTDVLIADLNKIGALSASGVNAAVNRTAVDVQRAEVKYVNLKTKRHTGGLSRIAIAFPQSGTAVVEPTAPYAACIEYGTRPHTIRARNKKVLASRQGGFTQNGIRYSIYAIFGKEVQHPGTAARPFVEPAARYGERQLENYLNEALNRALPK